MQLVNHTINGYKIVSFINKGGFGSVYKAEKDGDSYAVKVFSEDYVLREFRKKGEKKNRLQREIEIMKSVSHKYIVKYVDDFFVEDETGRNYFLAMEYITGSNLRELLNKSDKLDENIAIKIFKQLLEGLDYLHNFKGESDDYGIIHRDLKPENILIQGDGTIKIVDFGLSKAIDFTSMTSTGEVFGTGPYMSPEQITDSKNIDKRSDLYTAGVVLYEMLTGYFPYDFQYQPEMLDKIKNDPAIPPRRRNPKISNQIENIILKLLEKNPYQRYSRISDIIEAIDSREDKLYPREYDLSPRFILRLYNDKSVIEDFTKRNRQFGTVEFPANLGSTLPGLLKRIQDDANIQIIVDPATVRLAYSAYAETKGVRELPYAPNDYKIISPDNLSNYRDQKEYVRKVLEKELELNADILLTPFHYLHNSSLGYSPDRNQIAEWFDFDCKLAKESIDYRNTNCVEKDIYMGICIKADSFNDERSKRHLLNTITAIESDGFLIYADCIDNNTNEITLFNYIDFLFELQRWTKKPVIAGRINSGLGLGLLSLGIAGYTSGTARFESFYEGLYSETTESYNMYIRYYFPDLLGTVAIKRKTPTKYNQITSVIGSCKCHYCVNKSEPEIRQDKNVHLHFLENIYSEINHMKALKEKERIDYFLLRIDTAIEKYSLLKNVFKSDDYAYLSRWRNIFTKFREINNV